MDVEFYNGGLKLDSKQIPRYFGRNLGNQISGITGRTSKRGIYY